MNTTTEFETIIAPELSRLHVRGREVESLTMRGVEIAHRYLLARSSNKRERGIIRRSKHLGTLRGFAYNLRNSN